MALLSIILTGRDDNYTDDFLYRLRISLEFLSEGVQASDGRLEVIFVDYCTAKPISSAIQFSSPSKPELIKYVQVEDLRSDANSMTQRFDHSVAFGFGVVAAAGKYILLCPADTVFFPQCLSILLDLLESQDSPDCFWLPRFRAPGEYLIMRPNHRLLESRLRTNFRSFIPDSDYTNIFGNYGAFALQKQIWIDAGGIDALSDGGWGWSDIDLGLRLSYKYRQVDLLNRGVFCIDFTDIEANERKKNTPWYTNQFIPHKTTSLAGLTRARTSDTFLQLVNDPRTSDLVDNLIALKNFEDRFHTYSHDITALSSDNGFRAILNYLSKLPLSPNLKPEHKVNSALALYFVRMVSYPLNTVLFTPRLDNYVAQIIPLLLFTTHLTTLSRFDITRASMISGPLEHDNIYRGLSTQGIRRYYNLGFSEDLPEYLMSEGYDHIVCSGYYPRLEIVFELIKRRKSPVVALSIFDLDSSSSPEYVSLLHCVSCFASECQINVRVVSAYGSQTFFFYTKG